MKGLTKTELNRQLNELQETVNKYKKVLLKSVTTNQIYMRLIDLLVNFDLNREDRNNLVKQFIIIDTIGDAVKLYVTIKEELKNKQKE